MAERIVDLIHGARQASKSARSEGDEDGAA
jgi:hypothetical protein